MQDSQFLLESKSQSWGFEEKCILATKRDIKLAEIKFRDAVRKLKTAEDLFDSNPCEIYCERLERAEEEVKKTGEKLKKLLDGSGR